MIILGIDLGKARTGVAICDRGELLASPLTVVNEHNRERLVERLAALAQKNRAELLAVGLPRNMDGTEGESARPWWTPWPPPSSSKTIWTTAGCTSRKFDTGKITKQVYIFRKIQYTYSK